jgi:TRAP transporter TAXI family solute receptor
VGPIRRRTLLSLAPGLPLIAGPAVAQGASLRLGTAQEGGGFALYGSAFIDAIRLVDPTLEIRAVRTEGTVENVPRLESGDLDLGLAAGEVAHELFTGIGRPPTNLRVIAAMFVTPGMFVVRADARYRRIPQLKGQPVVWNGRNSGPAVQARYVMDGLGLDIERDFQPIYIERVKDGPGLVIDGTAAALWGGTLRWPSFVAVTNGVRGGRFVVPDAEEIKRIRAKYPFLAEVTVPAGIYRGQIDELQTVGTWSFVLARADLEDAMGYRLAAALHLAERKGQLTKPVAETTAQHTLTAIAGHTESLQPGVARYHKEAGLLR